MKKLLILGGSQQIGRRLIEKLLVSEVNKYKIFTFNRGKTNPKLFENEDVHKIIGDRDTDDIKQILRKDWDIVLDCSCYNPISFKELLKGIKGYIGRYIFISTISVYNHKKNILKNNLISEDYELLTFTEDQLKAKGNKYYAEKKVAAEKYLTESNINSTIFRPHFIYGIYDWQNLDYYWINRLRNFKEVLIPGKMDLIHRTYIDDLIKVLLDSFEKEESGKKYNVVTHKPISINDYLYQLSRIMKKEVSFVTVEPEKLIKNGIRPIFDIPLWSNGSHFVFSTKKMESDFKTDFKNHFQSLTETFNWNEKIKGWESGKSKWESGKFGLKREKEVEIIKVQKSEKQKKTTDNKA